MSDADVRRILIVTGDYAIVEQVRQAVEAGGFALQTAYSHADGLYSLENGEFDAVIADAGMLDRRSGERTLLALARLRQSLPVIGLGDNGEVGDPAALPANVMTAALDQEAIQQALAAALHISFGAGALPVNGGSPTESSDEIQTLFTLSKSLTEVLDLNEVLNRVVEAARRLTHAEEGMILLPDHEGGQLYLRAKVGIDVEVARNFRVKTEDTLAGHVFREGRPVLIGAQGPQKVKTEYLVNALLYVPILYKGSCIGVLGVNNKNTEAVFSPRHQEMLLNLAAFAAIAIENARAHEEALERTRELQMLVEASQSINASISLDRTLPNVCEQLVRVLKVSRSEIYEWDAERGYLRAQARCFRAVWQAGQGPVINLAARPILRAALNENKPAAISCGESAPPEERDYLDQVGAETIQMIPILGGSQTLGVVQTFYIQPPPTLPDGETLQRVQHLALEVLVTLSNQTISARIPGIFRVIEDINRLTGADWCELALLTPDKQGLVLHVAVGRAVWLKAPQPCIDLNPYPDVLEALTSQMPINKQADSKLISSGAHALLEGTQGRSILGLPLVQRGQVQGLVLFVDVRRGRAFNQRDVDMARTMVAQAATALENARLVHDLERSLKELRETQDRLVQTARLSAMGELAAAVAHQINNPLTTIMVDSEMLLLDEPPNSRNYQSLQAISRAGKRAAGVARRLLAIARPNTPDTPPQPIDVVDTIEGILSLVKSHIERDRIRVVTEFAETRLPPVWAVPGQLDDIWLNLVMNAHDALLGRDGARITMRAAYLPAQQIIEVIVSDNGPGIPRALLDEVFRPFFTTKPVGEGTGLGLHICRQTVERLGGSITVSSAPGDGTTFYVRLPVKKGAE
ncbi:MAG: GAF domain-containing protein [Chloroflexi bacterium]|nr:GAF domain-containing protein [Chloroflexota bacterium]